METMTSRKGMEKSIGASQTGKRLSHSPATFQLCVLKVKGPLSVGPRPVRPEPPLTCFSPLHWLGKLWDLRCSPSLCGFCLTPYPSVAILSPVLFPYQFSWKHFLTYSLKACSQGLVDVRLTRIKGQLEVKKERGQTWHHQHTVLPRTVLLIWGCHPQAAQWKNCHPLYYTLQNPT